MGKNIFTSDQTKQATKKEIEELKSMIYGWRYFPVNNVPIDCFGTSLNYDFETGNVVYLMSFNKPLWNDNRTN